MKLIIYGDNESEELVYTGFVKELQTTEYAFNRKSKLDLMMFLDEGMLNKDTLQENKQLNDNQILFYSGIIAGNEVNFDKPIWIRNQDRTYVCQDTKNIIGKILLVEKDENDIFKSMVVVKDYLTGNIVRITVRNLLRSLRVLNSCEVAEMLGANKNKSTNKKTTKDFKKSIKKRAKKIKDKRITERYIDF